MGANIFYTKNCANECHCADQEVFYSLSRLKSEYYLTEILSVALVDFKIDTSLLRVDIYIYTV